MSMYRETPCEHGLFDTHDWYTSKPLEHGDVPWSWFDGDCPGGSREEVTIDYEAFHKALYEWHHSERPMSSDVEKELIHIALGTEDE